VESGSFINNSFWSRSNFSCSSSSCE